MGERISYHEVVVFVDGKEYRVSHDYGIQLTCTRAAGWELWNVWGAREKLIGGEFGDKSFRIVVNGAVVCDDAGTNGVKPETASEI